MKFSRRGSISLGDLVIALKRLHPRDPEHAAKMAASLGFRLTDTTPEPTTKTGAWDAVRSPQREAPQGSKRDFQRLSSEIKPTRLAMSALIDSTHLAPKLESAYETRLEKITDKKTDDSPPNWVVSAANLELGTPDIEPPDRERLFPQVKARALLAAAVATRSYEGCIDLHRMVEPLMRLEHLTELPRQPVATLRRGVQLMLDCSEAMAPYLDDLDDLENALLENVGRDRVWTNRFTGAPSPRRKANRRPPRQTLRLRRSVPLLLATDFGLDAPMGSRHGTTLKDWRALANATQKRDIPVVALVPRKPSEWPLAVRGWFTLVHWDPFTTAGDIRRAVGPGHEVTV